MSGHDETASMCSECGAPVAPGATCLANFHALLALEWEIPGGPGERAHFLGVATYGIQHPESMGFTIATVTGLRSAVSDVLAARADVADIRRRVAGFAQRAGRVTRRSDDPVPRWPIESWPATVTEVVAGGADGYQRRVEEWAVSVIEALDTLDV